MQVSEYHVHSTCFIFLCLFCKFGSTDFHLHQISLMSDSYHENIPFVTKLLLHMKKKAFCSTALEYRRKFCSLPGCSCYEHMRLQSISFCWADPGLQYFSPYQHLHILLSPESDMGLVWCGLYRPGFQPFRARRVSALAAIVATPHYSTSGKRVRGFSSYS